jgi:VanZ family protein
LNIPPSWRRWSKRLFAAYVAIFFTLTHWPNLSVPGFMHRSDLVAHLGGLGTWATALIACGFFAPVFSTRNILIAWAVAVAYSGFDELTQAIPFIHRTCAWDDFFADTLGASLGAGAAVIVMVWLRRAARARPAATDPSAAADRAG